MGILKISFLLLVVNFINCIKIDCEFKKDYIQDGPDEVKKYTCQTRKFDVKEDNRKVVKVVGDHFVNNTIAMTNFNVMQFFARSLVIERFPAGLADHFGKLQTIRITSCGMRLLEKEDMAGLKNLKYLDLMSNKIESIDSNVFENALNLQKVIMNNNRLLYIGSRLMEPLKHLEAISFGGNVCVSSYFKQSQEQLLRLKTEIAIKCNDISMAEVLVRFDALDTKLDSFFEKLTKVYSKNDEKVLKNVKI